MADWTNLPNQAVGVGGLPSGTTVTALRDNPVAIAEGAAGAPRVQGVALSGIRIADEAGSRNSTGTSTLLTVIDMDAARTVLLDGFVFATSNPSGVIRYRTSLNNGSTWGTEITLASVPGGVDGTDRFTRVIDFSGGINAIQIRFSQGVISTGSVSAQAAVLVIEGEVT